MTYDLEVILKYRGRSSYDLFSSTLWGTRAYVGDLPMSLGPPVGCPGLLSGPMLAVLGRS